MKSLLYMLCGTVAASVSLADIVQSQMGTGATSAIELSSSMLPDFYSCDFEKVFQTNDPAIATLGQRIDDALASSDLTLLTNALIQLDTLEAATGKTAPVITARVLASIAGKQACLGDDVAVLRTLAHVLSPSVGQRRSDAAERATTLTDIEALIADLQSTSHVRLRGAPAITVTLTVQNKTAWAARVSINGQNIGDVKPRGNLTKELKAKGTRILFHAVAQKARRQWGPLEKDIDGAREMSIELTQ